MDEIYPCPVKGCEHTPFKTSQALASHMRSIHPDYTGETGTGSHTREVPIVEEDFASLLNKFKVKSPLSLNIAQNISHTGGTNVFEDPTKLFERLASWSSEIPPGTRKLVLEQWFAEKGIAIPTEISKKAALKDEELKAEARASEGVKYVYDTEHKVVRMAKQGEMGGTLEQAKELKKMADEADILGNESPFIPGEDGKLMLNPKARITGVEMLAWETLKKDQAAGIPVDPITALVEAAERMKAYKEALGGGSNLPPWMADPVTFMKMVQDLSGGGGATSELKTQLEAVQKAFQDLKDEQLRGTIEAQQEQIKTLTARVGQVLDRVDEIQRGNVGRTEMDILHEIATGGLSFFKQELPAFRGDLRSLVGGVGLPPIKSPVERAARKEQFHKGLEADKEIADLGQRLFLEQS